MKKYVIILIILSFILISCNVDPIISSTSGTDKTIENISSESMTDNISKTQTISTTTATTSVPTSSSNDSYEDSIPWGPLQ